MTEGYKPCDLCGSTIPDEPNELDDLRAEVERLRGEAARERAAVLAYLRAAYSPNTIVPLPDFLAALLRMVEKGEHHREGAE